MFTFRSCAVLLLGSLLLSGQGTPKRASAVDALYNQFRNPPKSNSLMPYWFWGGRITKAETRRQLEQMIAQGVTSAILYPWDGMEPRYLSEEYWQQFGYALDTARELGFTLNLNDDYDWPSGHAWAPTDNQVEWSQVLQRHPEFRMKRIDYEEQTVDGPQTVSFKDKPEFVVAGRLGSDGVLDPSSLTLIQDSVPAGRWLVTAYRIVPTTADHVTRIDLLNPDAVRAYIEVFYEELARRFPQHLGTTIQMTVADHEGAQGSPIWYTPRLWQEFQKRFGYDLKLALPLLTRAGERSRQVRTDFWNLISRMYTDAFTRQINVWCQQHGMKHGASAYEEQIYYQVYRAGDMFDFWRSGSVVEIDALYERARLPLDFKEAISVAHFDGKPLLVENQGLQGNGSFFSLEKARLGTNMALMWGANRLVPYFDYDSSKIQWIPQWFLSQPSWRYFRHYADYVRRVSYLNAQGRHTAPVLLYYPLESAFSESESLFGKQRRNLIWGNQMDQIQDDYGALQLELARQGWDYHVADRHYLENARIVGRSIVIGPEEFRVLILPPLTAMESAAMAMVRRCVAAGVPVFAVGDLPRGLDPAGIRRFPVRAHAQFLGTLDYKVRPVLPDSLREDIGRMTAALRAIEPPRLELPEGIYAAHRTNGDVEWDWVVNDSGEAREVDVQLPAGARFEKWDAETGAREAVGPRLRFGPWDAFVLVRNDSAVAPALPVRETVIASLPSTGWTFTPEAKELRVPYDGDTWLAPERLSHRNWYVRGPFGFDDHRGLFQAYEPETKPFQAELWTLQKSPTYFVTLPRDQGIYYAEAEVWSPEARRGTMSVAFADGLRAWWNEKEVLSVHRHPKWLLMRDCWAERRPIELRQGWNRVLLKVESSLDGNTAFLFRILTEQGGTMRDLRFRPEAAPDNVPEEPRLFPVAPNADFTLHSWTDDPKLAWYSGTAMYETSFQLGSDSAGQRLWLDLGAVGTAAEVWVNDKPAGERVWRPFRFDITSLVHSGTNSLRIRVANSDGNWLAQGDTIYRKGYAGMKFETERDRLPLIRPNGLEGPVRLLLESSK